MLSENDNNTQEGNNESTFTKGYVAPQPPPVIPFGYIVPNPPPPQVQPTQPNEPVPPEKSNG